MATWQMLAQRYRNQPNVIGADLKNEPHGKATWGDGTATDWRRAAERAGNAVLANAPGWLIVVEGTSGPVPGQQLPSHWWGGDLEAVGQYPVRLSTANRVVYSPHEYGPGVNNQPWFSDPNYQNVLYDRWSKGFQYIADRRRQDGAADPARQPPADLVPTPGSGGSTTTTSTTMPPSTIPPSTTTTTVPPPPPGSGLSARYVTDSGAQYADTGFCVQGPDRPSAVQALAAEQTPPPPPPTVPPTTTTTITVPPPGGLTARTNVDSQWEAGYCATMQIDNPTTRSIDASTIRFTLATTVVITGPWKGTIARSGGSVTVTLPDWLGPIPPGGVSKDFGFCTDKPPSTATLPANLSVS